MTPPNGVNASGEQFRRTVERLREELAETRAWCTSLEQQQAQLAAALLLAAPAARRMLSRFPLSAALPEEFPVHGGQ